jgi:hypothetical protein
MTTIVLTAPKRPKDTAASPDARLPTPAQRAWLSRGAAQPGGKLPLFDEGGQRISPRTIQSCLDQGWAAPWFSNPTKPDWLVCKLTDQGRTAIKRG